MQTLAQRRRMEESLVSLPDPDATDIKRLPPTKVAFFHDGRSYVRKK